MREEVKADLEDLVYRIDQLAKKFQTDPATDAQFACRTLGTCLAQLNMKMGEMYGVRLMPVPMVFGEASFTEGLETPTVT